MTKTKALLLGLLLNAGAATAQAQVDGHSLANDYLAQGYSWVEVTLRAATVKVEAVSGATQVEVVYDRATGAVLSQETGPARLRDQMRSGVEVRDRSTVDRDQGRGRGRGGDDPEDDHGTDDTADDHGGRGRGCDDR